MTSTIIYEPVDGVVLSTARPDGLWRELVRVFVPSKSRETGDDDPYGARAIELGPNDVAALAAMAAEWPEVAPLLSEAEKGKLWVRREP